jgi:pimeloyl-ACP methyl ester carboxylesterase
MRHRSVAAGVSIRRPTAPVPLPSSNRVGPLLSDTAGPSLLGGWRRLVCHTPPVTISQRIRFATTSDQASIAYGVTGSGPALVKAANWLTHLEYDLESPVWRPYIEALSARFEMIRYDGRGTGLSDQTAGDMTFEQAVTDLEAVVDASGVDRFGLLGVSQGGSVAIGYAVRHPERVTHLVVVGGFARGQVRRGNVESEKRHHLFQQLAEVGWDIDDPTFRRVFTSQLIPDGTARQHRWFDDLIRRSSSREAARALMNVFSSIDVTEEARAVACPTLVVHSRGDHRVPFDEGRLIASLIPDARLVQLDSENHLPLDTEPAWEVLVAEMVGFVLPDAPSPSHPAGGWVAMLMTDIVDSTRMVSAIGDEAWAHVIQWHDRTLEELIVAGDGRVVSNTGDGFLATFTDVASAVECAVGIQRVLARHRSTAGYAPGVRMGVNGGVITRGSDGLSGIEIHKTARIAAAAGRDEVVVDAGLSDQLDSRFTLNEPHVVAAKGIDEDVTVVSIDWR